LLSTGRLDADPKGASESLKLVRKLIVENEMPACRAVLFDRLKRELNTTKPLNRNDPDSERAALTKLEMLLKTNDGKFIGDDEVKVAFARRQEELRKMLLRKMGVGI
ncbi:MAG: hypothetical protein HY057_02660, partial [Rhodospirillales bacterium]|nr:hypothetical protein [Rhodospirillales bacterium]